MRPIRLRAWDSKKRIFFTAGLYIDNPDFLVAADVGGADDIFPMDNVVLMQGLGLKDKNGQEIYEGDIIKNTMLTETRLRTVVWNRDRWGLSEDLTSTPHWERWEVVGNIYENPDLIKEVKA